MQDILLPIFPLELVVFEGESLNLHIFEPRYKTLIRQCFEANSSFFIPTVLNGAVFHSGCQLQVKEIQHVYEGGEMDITCQALSRGDVVEFYQSENANTASTALVRLNAFQNDEEKELNLRIVDLCEQLYETVQADFDLDVRTFHYLDVVHKCGLTLEQELEMVSLDSVSDRQLYLINHLKTTVLTLAEIDLMKKKIQLNGHFKKISQSH